MNSHIIKSFLILFGIIGIILTGKILFTPDSWGKYGHYRADYIEEEASRENHYGENESCASCHEEVNELKDEGKHKGISCEICHSPLAEHIKDGKKFADMKVSRDDEIDETCMKCHQANVIGRPASFPTIDKEYHLKDQKVGADHNCNQCHTVHHPMENINEAKRMSRNLLEVLEDEK